jgi:hemerythrin-like domain-containing protein
MPPSRPAATASPPRRRIAARIDAAQAARGAACDACTMQSTALDIVREEHQALAVMLRSLRMLVESSHRQRTPPPFEVLRAMLLYVDEFPDRLHHPKEEGLLFPRVRERCPELAAVLDRLQAEHDAAPARLREVEHALLGWEVLGEPRRDAFEQALRRYVDFYLSHMALEEREVLPAAERRLSATDWVELDAAFAANQDPLTGHEPTPDYRPLFSRIVALAPAPVGLGPPA